MSTSEIAPGVGAERLCADCPHVDTLRSTHQCQPVDVCVLARSGRRIDRFLRAHPELAIDYLADWFWERRAIAARYAPLDAVRPLASDSDEVVRRVVATRLPPEELACLCHDADCEVRIAVACRLSHGKLSQLRGMIQSARCARW